MEKKRDKVLSAAKRVEASGGEIFYGPIAVPGGARVVHCRDPQGALFALIDWHVRITIGCYSPSRRRPSAFSGRASRTAACRAPSSCAPRRSVPISPISPAAPLAPLQAFVQSVTPPAGHAVLGSGLAARSRRVRYRAARQTHRPLQRLPEQPCIASSE